VQFQRTIPVVNFLVGIESIGRTVFHYGTEPGVAIITAGVLPVPGGKLAGNRPCYLTV
jgi:hypothetical protein